MVDCALALAATPARWWPLLHLRLRPPRHARPLPGVRDGSEAAPGGGPRRRTGRVRRRVRERGREHFASITIVVDAATFAYPHGARRDARLTCTASVRQ